MTAHHLRRCSSSLPDLRTLEDIKIGTNNQQIPDRTIDFIKNKTEYSASALQFEPSENGCGYDKQLHPYDFELSQTPERNVAVQNLSGFFLGDTVNKDEEGCMGNPPSPQSVLDIDRKMSQDSSIFDNSPNLVKWGSAPLKRRKSCLKKSRIKSQENFNKVSFAPKSSVRYYDICLGDNPSCSYGIPISLGWDYEEDEVDLKRRLLRNSVQRLSYHDRRNLLQSAGYEYNEMRSTLLEIKRVQRSRLMTELLIPVDNMVDAVFDNVQKIFSPDNNSHR